MNDQRAAEARLHDGEIKVTESQIRALLADQHPHLAKLALHPVASAGTVNWIWRLGSELYVRLPRLAEWADSLKRELEILPKIAPKISLRIPGPVAVGAPGYGYRFPWAVYRWIEGSIYREEAVADERQAGLDLANFVGELRGLDLRGVSRAGRSPLRELDAVTRAAIDACEDLIDAPRARDVWIASLRSEPWDGEPAWIHCDLLRPNLLISGGRLCAVLDFGSAGLGDPAADLIAAWSVFNEPGRQAFREALGGDGETWKRARGYALHQAALIVPYYARSHPEFAASAVRTIEQVLVDSYF